MKRIFLMICLVGLAVSVVRSEPFDLPKAGKNTLESRFRSWKLAEIKTDGIVEYYKRERNFERPNLIKGDFDGDGRTDFAALLEHKRNAENMITVVLMRRRNGYKTYILEGSDCLMSVKKGEKGYDHEAQRSFRYKRDAVFICYWEKGGSSYLFERGKFRAIVTSD
jgi:hypothetical protein